MTVDLQGPFAVAFASLGHRFKAQVRLKEAKSHKGHIRHPEYHQQTAQICLEVVLFMVQTEAHPQTTIGLLASCHIVVSHFKPLGQTHLTAEACSEL